MYLRPESKRQEHQKEDERKEGTGRHVRDRFRIGDKRQSRTGRFRVRLDFLFQFSSEKSDRREDSETREDTRETIARNDNTHLPKRRRHCPSHPHRREERITGRNYC